MNNQKIIDLRSDTLTKPSVGMRNAMTNAEVGDDVYSEDPTVNSLEARVARLFGKEAALFCPSGSLANQLALRMLVAPGEELITETNSHIVRAELGAAAVFSGITTRTWFAKRGLLKAEDVFEIIKPNSGPYLVSTAAIAIENTHNFGGGTIQPLDEISKLRKVSSDLGVKMHMDGARIWNAHVASGVSLIEYAKHFDTLSVCLSKGLGAPIGSLMVSSKDTIDKARGWRKRYGGGMRQVGIIAAAGHYALDHNISLLSRDHERAKQIAICIEKDFPDIIDSQFVETNIIGLDFTKYKNTSAELAQELGQEGILSSALGASYLRFVTHFDLTDLDIEKIILTLPKLLKRTLVLK
jgi:threonine aldolase